MKSLIHTSILISTSVMLALTGAVIYTDFTENTVDDNGMRQGYWVITGSMTADKSFKSNAIVEEGRFEDDLKTGIWKKYYPSGKLRSEITFSKNKPIGEYILYYENGVIEEDGNWQRNKNIGEFSRNYVNGNPHQKFVFADSGKRNGKQLYYHENGQLALEVNIVNGKEDGVMKRYNDKGKLTEEKTFDGGNYVLNSKKDYSKDTQSYVPQPVKEENVDLTPSAPKEKETNAAHHFKPNGHNVLYDRNKNISQTGLFKQGRLYDGKWYKYNTDGILIRVDIYRKGKFVGHGLLEK